MIIKVLLLGAALVLAFTAARTVPGPGHLALRRICILVTLAAAALAVLFPDMVTEAARLVGVGRGTDLVLYAFIVVAVVGWLATSRRLAELDSKLAQVVRAHAVAEAARERSASIDPATER
jgi:hypothetical protein